MSQKYPDPIDGYDFMIGRGGKPTYRLNRKMTAAENVTEHIKAQLLENYEILTAQRAEENARAEAEEAAKSAEELVNQPPAAVDFTDDTLDDVEIAQPAPEPDFNQPQVTMDSEPRPRVGYPAAALPQAPAGGMTAEEQAILDAYPTDPRVAPEAPAPAEIPQAVDVAAMQQELDRRKGIIENLMKLTISEATLQEVALS